MLEKPCEDYLHWYYDTRVWKQVAYRGVRTLKSVSDMWNYQEIFHQHGIQWVIELGSRHGGSALFFADLLAAESSPGVVVSVDYAPELHPKPLQHTKIVFLQGDSATPDMVAQVQAHLPPLSGRGPVFLILDSDHRRDHVLRELSAYVPLLQRGDYLIVEDTCINGHPLRPDFGPGPMEAIRDYVAQHPSLLMHDAARERKFGFSFAPFGYFLKT